MNRGGAAETTAGGTRSGREPKVGESSRGWRMEDGGRSKTSFKSKSARRRRRGPQRRLIEKERRSECSLGSGRRADENGCVRVSA